MLLPILMLLIMKVIVVMRVLSEMLLPILMLLIMEVIVVMRML